MQANLKWRNWTRLAFYCFVIIAACPIRYWPLMDGVDATWVFALNYTAAHGLKAGRDILFTYGFLGYLTFPQAFGNNLNQGLIFQACLWLAIAWVIFDLFFRANLLLRNLALFGFFFALSTPLYWFNFGGVENLALMAALVGLYLYGLCGLRRHYLFALISIGIIPLIKLSAGLVAAAALGGFLIDRVVDDGWRARRDIVPALLIPAAVSGALTVAVLGGWRTPGPFLHAAASLIAGYTAAMSFEGDCGELVTAGITLAALACLLRLFAQEKPVCARFSFSVLAGPLFLSFKHGFVRQDIHVVNYFSFVALGVALIAFRLRLHGRRIVPLSMVLAVLALCCGLVNIRNLGANTFSMATGLRSAQTAWSALWPARLHRNLTPCPRCLYSKSPIEPEIREIVGAAPVAALSASYSFLGTDGWNPRFFPVIQMYSAYTPYLDAVNADWVRGQGPQYLIYDGLAIGGRDSWAWAATPATWLEVYRWYETRWLGRRNLLLQRRTTPRFSALDRVARFAVSAPVSISLPLLRAPVFWTLRCVNSLPGQIRQALFRTPDSEMEAANQLVIKRRERVLPQMTGAPVMGSYLPATLTEFGAVFQPQGTIPAIRTLTFRGRGMDYYASACEVELFLPRYSR